mmetsp:Transcript_85376/g.194702  ORF Transcript_85376/g.194702 Transcript_85376/m.194702 type:complete len:306 (+) Transcript_85376:453-1370(+)
MLLHWLLLTRSFADDWCTNVRASKHLALRAAQLSSFAPLSSEDFYSESNMIWSRQARAIWPHNRKAEGKYAMFEEDQRRSKDYPDRSALSPVIVVGNVSAVSVLQHGEKWTADFGQRLFVRRAEFFAVDLSGSLHRLSLRLVLESDTPSAFAMAPRVGGALPAPATCSSPDALTKACHHRVSDLISDEFELQTGPSSSWALSMTWYGPSWAGSVSNVGDYHARFLATVYRTLANASLSRDVVLCEGDFGAAHVTLRGNHVGQLGSLKPTGQLVEMRVASHWRLEGDFFVEGWTLVDFDGLVDQLV